MKEAIGAAELLALTIHDLEYGDSQHSLYLGFVFLDQVSRVLFMKPVVPSGKH